MKKFLSLVLALIMTMSLVTISAGATEYKDLSDKDEIQYEEAVAVLNRIGVITGYEDGTFRPETELTRGAAAKIIVSLMIGPDAANALPNTSSPYSDVPASHTFAGVISYCKTAGYISGYSDGTFKPAGTLTGYAFAKMLLGALGYKSDIEGFTGYGWTNNVARVGNLAQLFDRISFDGAAAVNRDQACQLALNTLKATMVEYSKSTVSGPNGSYTVEGQAQPRTSNNRDINANIGRKDWYGGNNQGSDYLTLEFGEEHFKDLRLEHDRFDPAHDQFGRPSNEWSYKKVTIGTFPLAADFTYTTQVAHIEETDGAKEKALGLRNYDLIADGGYSIWNGWGNTGTVTAINGGTTTLWLNGLEDADYFDAVDNNGKYTHKVADIANFTDNGTLVEVYVSDIDADWITDVVVIQTQLMTVKKIGSDYVSLERYDSPDALKNASPRGTANIGFNLAPIEVNIEQVKDNNEDCYNILKGMKADDYVAVVPVTTDNGKTYEAAEVYVPETVSGALTRVDTYGIGTDADKERGAVSITVGGTAYKLADWNDKMWELKTEDIKATRKDVTLVMDKYGNAFLAKDVGATNDFMVIGNFYQALAGNKICTFVHGWDISGNEVDLNLGSSIKVKTHGNTQSVDNHVLGELVYYTSDGANGDADYVLRHVSAKGDKLVRDVYTNLERSNNNNKVEDAKADYEIKASNLLIPVVTTLTDAEIKAGKADTDNTFGESVADYGRTNTQADGNGLATHDTTYADTNYIDRYYDKGVKFIYVNYVAGDDEVESVEFKSGVQNVSQDELRQAIMNWPAQVAVKDDQVKAVVIKRESNDANINRMLYVTKTLGFKEYDSSTNESFYEVEVAMFTSDGKFVTEQHIIVNKDLQIGDFATYTKVAGTKYEDNYYRVKEFVRHNTNPAALRVEKVSTVMSTVDGKMVKHLMELGAKETYNLYNGKQLVGDIGDDGSDAVMYEESYVLGGYRGSSTTVPNTVEKANGIIRADKAEWLNATRDSTWDDIDSVEDLFDRIINHGRVNDIDVTKAKQTLDNVTLKILLNEKPDSDGFRSAYLIVIADVDGEDAPVLNDPLNTGYALYDAYTTTYDRSMVKGDKFSVTVKDGYKLDLANVKGAIMIDHNVDESYWTFERTTGTVIIPLIKDVVPAEKYKVTVMVDGKEDPTLGFEAVDGDYTINFRVPEGRTFTDEGKTYVAGEIAPISVSIAGAPVTVEITTNPVDVPPSTDVELTLAPSAEGDDVASAVKAAKNAAGDKLAVTGLGDTGHYKVVVVADGKAISETTEDGEIEYKEGATVYVQKGTPTYGLEGGFIVETGVNFKDELPLSKLVEQSLQNAPEATSIEVVEGHMGFLCLVIEGKTYTVEMAKISVNGGATKIAYRICADDFTSVLNAFNAAAEADRAPVIESSEEKPAAGFVNVGEKTAVSIPLDEKTGEALVEFTDNEDGTTSITPKEGVNIKVGDKILTAGETLTLDETSKVEVVPDDDPAITGLPFTITPSAAASVLGKKVADMQSDVKVSVEDTTIKVTGSLNYIPSYGGFEANADGWFVALDLDASKLPETIKGIKLTRLTAEGKLDTDESHWATVVTPKDNLVIRVVKGADSSKRLANRALVVEDVVSGKKMYTIDCSGLTLVEPTLLKAAVTKTTVLSDLGDMKVADLQENLNVVMDGTTIKLSGTLKPVYKDPWDDFSSTTDYQKGYYVVFNLDCSGTKSATVSLFNTTTNTSSKSFAPEGMKDDLCLMVAGVDGKKGSASILVTTPTGAKQYTINYDGLTLADIPSLSVKATDATESFGEDFGNVKVSDIQTGVNAELKNGTIYLTGTLKPTKFTKGWLEADMNGYFVAFDADARGIDGEAVVTVTGPKGNSGTGSAANPTALIRVADYDRKIPEAENDNPWTLTVKVGDEVKATYPIDADGLVLQPTQVLDVSLSGDNALKTLTNDDGKWYRVKDLQDLSDLTVDEENNKIIVKGTLNLTRGWTGFSSKPEEQEGYYLTFHVKNGNGFAEGSSIKFGVTESAVGGNNDDICVIVARKGDTTATDFEIKVVKDGADDIVYTVDCSGLTLDPTEVEPSGVTAA